MTIHLCEMQRKITILHFQILWVNVACFRGLVYSKIAKSTGFWLKNSKVKLSNFFKSEHILQLRQLALQEVVSQIERKVETSLPQNMQRRERFLACISSQKKNNQNYYPKNGTTGTLLQSKMICFVCPNEQRKSR